MSRDEIMCRYCRPRDMAYLVMRETLPKVGTNSFSSWLRAWCTHITPSYNDQLCGCDVIYGAASRMAACSRMTMCWLITEVLSHTMNCTPLSLQALIIHSTSFAVGASGFSQLQVFKVNCVWFLCVIGAHIQNVFFVLSSFHCPFTVHCSW